MKNLKMFAIGLAAFAAMTMGVRAVTQDTISVCTGTDTDNITCTLTTDDEISSALTVSEGKVVTINANGHTIKLLNNLTVKGTLNIVEGNLDIAGKSVTIQTNGKLSITGAKAKTVNGNPIAALHDSAAVSNKITVNGGTLEVSNNEDRGILFVKEIDLKSGAKFVATNNKENVMNGIILKADASTVEVTKNNKGGVNGQIILSNGSTLTATDNGLQGVTLNTGSKIGKDSKIVATGNNTNTTAYTPDRTPSKGDVLLNGTVTVEKGGSIEAGTVAPLKNTWAANTADQTVVSTNLVVAEGGIVKTEEFKEICAGTATACTDAKGVTIATNSKGIVYEGDTVTVYGNIDDNYEFGSDVKNVVISSGVSTSLQFTVAPGTSISNNSNVPVVVTPKGGAAQVVSKATTATVGQATTEPTEPQDPSTTEPTVPGDEGQNNNPVVGDEANSQQPTDNVPVAKTGDNIVTFMGLGLASLAVVAYGTKNLKKQFN